MAFIIGVTGSIAAGKSYLCAHLVDRYGAVHIDADREAHRLYAPGTPGFDRVVAEFGADIVEPDGVINRRILGSRVFGNAERMAALREAMGDIPAYFRGLLERWRTELPADGLGVFEAVNLVENGYLPYCDTSWLVVCERETAIARMVSSRGLTREEAEQRLASARDWHERAPLVDHVIHNDGTLEDLEAAISDRRSAIGD